MTKQYGRRYRIEIGNNEDGFAIETLKCEFEFEKSITPTPNNGKVRIYNLNPSHRRQILSKQFKNVRVSVGYNELRQIFLGEIIKAAQTFEGLDWVIELELSDGSTDYIKSYAAMTIKSGSTDNDVINKLTQTLGNTVVGDIAELTKKPLPRGKVLFGNTRDLLNQVTQDSDSDWSIQDGELIVLPPNALRDDQAVLLTQETGMIGAPEATDNGLTLTCLLNPSLKIGGLVRVVSIDSAYNGDYKIVNLKYQGDTHDSIWQNELVVVGGQFYPVKPSEEK